MLQENIYYKKFVTRTAQLNILMIIQIKIVPNVTLHVLNALIRLKINVCNAQMIYFFLKINAIKTVLSLFFKIKVIINAQIVTVLAKIVPD